MKLQVLCLAAATATLLSGCEKRETPAGEAEVLLETQEAKISYILGADVGSQFKNEDIIIDEQALLAGINDAASDKPPRMNQEEVGEVWQAFQEEQLARREAELQAQSEANLQEGQAFLAENATKEGVVTLESGLQYRVLNEGEGKSPGAEDTVQVHYRGTLVNGTEFDSSFKRGVPAEFGVNHVIPGWIEALQLMKEGAKWELYIPSDLAYGPRGTGSIGPNQTLLFEVELLKVGAEETGESASE